MYDPTDSLSAICVAHGPAEGTECFAAGTVFGDWRLTAFIGRGGSGEVYCAEHVALGTAAAVKVLVSDEPRARARFAREAKLLSELKSASFPRFFASGEANGHAYLVMELLEPGELPSGERAIASFLLKVCDAVAELHAQGLVHRDIKPSNILWRTGATGSLHVAFPVLADLGLAKAADTATGSNLSFAIYHSQFSTRHGVGTPGYGAPEQMERGEATPAADIHALGVLADRCFGGKPPSRAWARIIHRATSSIPERRYQSIASFANAIRRRHRAAYLATFLSVVSSVLVAGMLLHTQAEEWWGRQKDRWSAPVLDASAVIDGAKADNVRWFLDDLPVDMPHSFVHRLGEKHYRMPRRLCAVAWQNGKTYSAKRADIIPDEWTGSRRLSLELKEDPPYGTIVKISAADGTPFEFAWCSPRDTAEVGSGFWMARTKLSSRQFASIVKTNPHPRFGPPQSVGVLDYPVTFSFLGVNTVPTVSLDGPDIRLEPPDFQQWRRGKNVYIDQSEEMPEWASVPLSQNGDGFSDSGWMKMDGTGQEVCIGNHVVNGFYESIAPAYVRYMAVSAFWYETNMVRYCTARALLQSKTAADVMRGESMIKSFLQSDDMALKAKAMEICIERGLSSLDDFGGTNAALRLRFAAVERGDTAVLEQLAAMDPDLYVRRMAYDKLTNPSPMVSARYIAQIRAEDNPGDISKPIRILEALTDREALRFLAEHGQFGYFRDEAQKRLKALDRK